ncbi:conserved hypothetical protein [Uncinocarpus reesii 1704]|uniref:J domain-containing protein n=1 Tax=Uncinocarpus reesii (strain UAMH 1704) TaxID=336963 RepID=C4JII4_UNCRE|nr:uncharacterized protein UREG_01521 [Uncinocarpus reesii 1704]EEP76672.1 conserved hypothetical protein [Uncinocarpus reesii 1704]
MHRPLTATGRVLRLSLRSSSPRSHSTATLDSRTSLCVFCQHRQSAHSRLPPASAQGIAAIRTVATSSPKSRPSAAPSAEDSAPLTELTPDISNHYTIFPKTLPQGPPPASPFDIPASDLRREFLALQGHIHPDKYPSGAAKQRAEALSARINDAYRTLLDPLNRAQYLLAFQHGIDVTSEDGAKKYPQDTETLMQVLEAQEAIEEAEGEATILELKSENERRVNETIQVLGEAIDQGDVDRAVRECVRLRFWYSIRDVLREWEPAGHQTPPLPTLKLLSNTSGQRVEQVHRSTGCLGTRYRAQHDPLIELLYEAVFRVALVVRASMPLRDRARRRLADPTTCSRTDGNLKQFVTSMARYRRAPFPNANASARPASQKKPSRRCSDRVPRALGIEHGPKCASNRRCDSTLTGIIWTSHLQRALLPWTLHASGPREQIAGRLGNGFHRKFQSTARPRLARWLPIDRPKTLCVDPTANGNAAVIASAGDSWPLGLLTRQRIYWLPCSMQPWLSGHRAACARDDIYCLANTAVDAVQAKHPRVSFTAVEASSLFSPISLRLELYSSSHPAVGVSPTGALREMARPAPDFNSIIHSPPFTFLVGPDHIKLTIQSGLARHVSQPLDELMNNGHTRESRHHIAVLEEEDVETFVGFCEFAYTGDYTVPRRRTGAETKPHGVAFADPPMVGAIPPPAPSPPQTPGFGDEGAADESRFEDGGDVAVQDDATEALPDAGKKGKKAKNKKKKGGKSFDEALTPPSTPPPMAEGEKEEPKEEPPTEEGQGEAAGAEWFDQEAPKKSEETSRPKPLRPEPQNPFFFSRRSSVTLWDEFTALQYAQQQHKSAMGLPSPILRSVSSYASDSSSQDPYVLFHAKLYRFASRYLIPTLAQLCLIKLHHDLVNYPLTAPLDNTRPTNIPMILELLHFAYTNTKRDDPVFALTTASAARENQLRKLVTHFAACKVRDLAGYQPLAYSPTSYGTPEMGLAGKDAGLSSLTIPLNLGFRDLLDGIGEMASDLVYRMM